MSAVPSPDQAITELEDRLRRYPADRFPVQHARSLNVLGATLRAAGRVRDAVAVFRDAVAAFRAAELGIEEGAATFNLGLVLRESDDPAAALDAFVRARRLFPSDAATPEAAAAAREMGAALVVLDRHAEAVPVLEEAIALARRGGDRQTVAAATNTLGLAQLGVGDARAAAEMFRAVVSASPRSISPDGYAMAKANLALALERTGDHTRARVAAAQAAGVPGAPQPVRLQAVELLQRLGEWTGALAPLLLDEPMANRAAVMRDEVIRWLDVDEGDARVDVAAFVAGVAAEPEHREHLCELWLAALLELPTDEMERLLRLVLEAWASADDEARDLFRGAASRGMGAFHAPQWMRLKDTLNRLATEAGHEAAWG